MQIKDWCGQNVGELPWWAGCAVALAALLFGFNIMYMARVAWDWLQFVPWSADAMPAWIQALGSVIAIFAAIWIARTDKRNRASDQRALDQRYIQATVLIAVKAVDAVVYVINTVPEFFQLPPSSRTRAHAEREWKDNEGILDAVTTDLQKVDAMKIIDVDLAAVFLKLKNMVALSRHLLQTKIYEQNAVDFSDINGWQAKLTDLKKELVRLSEKYK